MPIGQGLPKNVLGQVTRGVSQSLNLTAGINVLWMAVELQFFGFLGGFPVFHGRFLSDFATKTSVVCEENDGNTLPVRVAKVLVLIPQPNGLLLWREHPKGICIRTGWGLSLNPNQVLPSNLQIEVVSDLFRG